MRYTIVVLWTLIIGQLVGYIGGALNHQAYNPVTTFIVSLIAGLLVILIGFIAMPDKKKATAQK